MAVVEPGDSKHHEADYCRAGPPPHPSNGLSQRSAKRISGTVPELCFGVAGVARLQTVAGKTELWRVRLRILRAAEEEQPEIALSFFMKAI